MTSLDPELKIASAILDALQHLDTEGQLRVLSYVRQRIRGGGKSTHLKVSVGQRPLCGMRGITGPHVEDISQATCAHCLNTHRRRQ